MPTLERGFTFLALAVAVLIGVSIAFAAVALLLRVRNLRIDRRRARLTARWEPGMLEVLAGSGAPQTVFGRVRPEETADFLTFLLGYARRLRGEERDVVHALAEPYLPRLVRDAESRSAEARGLAIQALAGMGMPQYADTVAGALDDESAVVAMIAARGLFRPGLERHFPTVLNHLPRFTLWSRSFVASMLAGGGPAAAEPLQSIMADHARPPLVRAIAADALRVLNDLPAVEIANDILHVETDAELIVACLRLIRHLGHREHADVVRPFTTSPNPVVRASAAGALGAIGEHKEVQLLHDMLDDVAYWVSLEAARGLLALGEAPVLRRLANGAGPWAVLARQVLSE